MKLSPTTIKCVDSSGNTSTASSTAYAVPAPLFQPPNYSLPSPKSLSSDTGATTKAASPMTPTQVESLLDHFFRRSRSSYQRTSRVRKCKGRGRRTTNNRIVTTPRAVLHCYSHVVVRLVSCFPLPSHPSHPRLLLLLGPASAASPLFPHKKLRVRHWLSLRHRDGCRE